MKPRINPFEKRQKEFERKERQKQKAERRGCREREKAERPTTERVKIPISRESSPGRSRHRKSNNRTSTGHEAASDARVDGQVRRPRWRCCCAAVSRWPRVIQRSGRGGDGHGRVGSGAAGNDWRGGHDRDDGRGGCDGVRPARRVRRGRPGRRARPGPPAPREPAAARAGSRAVAAARADAAVPRARARRDAAERPAARARGGTTGAAGSAGNVGTTGGAGTAGTAGTTGAGGSADVCARWKADRADLSEGTWTGDVTSCTAGDIGATARANALRLVNLYRWLAAAAGRRHRSDARCAGSGVRADDARQQHDLAHAADDVDLLHGGRRHRRRQLERLQRARGQLRRPLHDRLWQRDDDRPPPLDAVELARADRHRRHRQGVVHVDAERHRQGGQGVDGVARGRA